MDRGHEKYIRMIVNNTPHCYIDNGTQAIEAILELGIEQLKYMSKEAMIDWIEGALDLATEISTWKRDTQLKKRIALYRKSLEHVSDRNSAMMLYSNIVLSCTGLSCLSGFSMANIENRQGRAKTVSKIRVNPEKRSIY